MKMKRFLLVAVWVLFIQSLFADIPTGYYDSATGTSYALKTQLYNIIKDHTSVSYTPGVWNAFYTTDDRADGYVWDTYSNCEFTFGDDQDTGSGGTSECEYYNREHSFPRSWFGGEVAPMNTDIFHIYPTDKKVNNVRLSYSFGRVGSASYTSSNGSKLGASDFPGYSGTVFEPIDEYKGDFARTYFYMVTRYENIISTWPASDMLDGSNDQCFSEWALEMLTQWHNNDPVSQKEIDRNDAVYAIQDNRNPFIDHPEYVAEIWGGAVLNNPPVISNVENNPTNPTSSDAVSISATITDSDGNITNAELHWGLSSGSLANTIAMLVSLGDTYTSNSDIPTQTDGTTVYYEIEATDDSSDVTTSSENTYTVDDNSTVTIFEEDFETATLESPITINDWILYDEAGTATWLGKEYNSNKYAQMTAYLSGETSNISWLITREIDLTGIASATFSFISKDGYNNGDPVEVFISTDYTGTGDPNGATWNNLNPTLATGSSSGYASSFTESGNIDISSYCGNSIYIAYKYTGGDPSLTTTMQIDDILIVGNTSSSNIAPEISGISINPTSPTEEEDVTISAIIIDSDGTITSANIKWGTSTGNYPNTVSMTNTDNDYSGVILSQPGGTTVYYIIEATDDEPETTQSSENSFAFNTTGNELPQITDIDYNPTNPESTESVSVSATITDSDGSITTADIKWGTSTGNYPNTVSMSNSGDDYTGVILAQADETHIYFVIYTVDNDGGSVQSSENDYVVDDPNILPEISGVDFTPTDPESTESVSVSATITDSDGSITTADIKWGTSTGNYPNTVSMSHSGDDYTGVIPAQADETHIYFVIYTVDNDGGSVQSSENDYVVDDPNVLPDITGVDFTPTDPESTETVTVSATITDSDGTIASATIKWGTTSGNYNNNVTMSADNDVYSGMIPALSDGTHVYFVIHTVDNDGGSVQSSENDYVVDDPNILPEISGVDFTPTDPESTESVSVSATITDSDGSITTADIKWGTSTGNYPNTVSMSNTGDDYSGVISTQADGTEVFFVIEAEDNEAGITLSSELNYTVEDPENQAPVISDVILDPSSPTEDENPIVSCIADDADGSVESVVLKWKRGTGDYTDVNMNFSGGRYYGQIPKQSVGETIYFSIIAEDNEGLQSNYEGSYEISESNSINDLGNSNLRIYPNPTINNINIELIESGFINSIKVYNLIGEKMLEISNLNVAKYTIELSRFPKGMYIIQINDSENSIVRKVMLK